MTGGIDIATIVHRCRDHSGIASVQALNASIDVDLVRSRPAPGETHRIYSVDLAPLGPERDLWRRCWRRRGRTGLRAVSAAGVHIAKAMKSAPDDHFTVGPHCRVIGSASGCVGSARGRPAIRAGIVSPRGCGARCDGASTLLQLLAGKRHDPQRKGALAGTAQ